MKITAHVKTVEEIEATRSAIEGIMQPGDDAEIIVAGMSPAPAERQEARPAAGLPGGMGGG